MRVTEKAKKAALAIAFGVAVQGSMISGIPGAIPGLPRALSCGNCKMQLSKGVPSQFVAYMSEEQKKAFKQAIKRKAKK